MIAGNAPSRSVIGSNPTSKATPQTPSTSPRDARRERAFLVQTAPMTAPQIGAVALRMDSRDADSVFAAKPNNRKGIAELKSPSTR